MLSGDNSILNRAGEARDKTKESQKDEEVKIAVLGSYGSNARLDINKLLTNLNGIEDITVTPTENNGTNTFPVTVETEYTTYEITNDGDFREIQTADRTGISVGDYITYISPTASVTFSDVDTGYSMYATTPATLTAKDTFRVMDIDKYGNMILMGAMTPSDPTIYFSGAKGYNNAVYTLNKKCSDLYKDTSKGITARSIKIEDITDRMIQGTTGETTAASTGKKKLEKFQNEKVVALTTVTYITDTDTTKNTVTYKTTTNYPDIFQYEAGGLIDSTASSGVIGQSDSYSEYNGLTTLSNKTPIPINLTVPYTYYSVSPTTSDFDNTKGNATTYQNMFFGTGTYYWIASRCICCESDFARFSLRLALWTDLGGAYLYDSYGSDKGNSGNVCPIVYLPSSVEVEISANPKNQTNTNGTAHKVK